MSPDTMELLTGIVGRWEKERADLLAEYGDNGEPTDRFYRVADEAHNEVADEVLSIVTEELGGMAELGGVATYMIVATNSDGVDLSLLVNAYSTREALKLWSDHYSDGCGSVPLSGLPRLQKLEPAIEPGVIEWDLCTA